MLQHMLPGMPVDRERLASTRLRRSGPLELVRLSPLMKQTSGSPEIRIGLIDGPVALDHPDLAVENIKRIGSKSTSACTTLWSAACLHGTFVAGILSGKRDSPAPATCPGCTLLVRPVFPETSPNRGETPSATAEELARAVLDCVDAGARVVNISAALGQTSIQSDYSLECALDRAAVRGTLVVVAAGNQGAVGSTALTRHPWVIPVVAYDLRGRLAGRSNVGVSIGRRGLGGPGEGVTSLGSPGKPLTMNGTSAAAPFVTAAIALLWSEFPNSTAARVRVATLQSGARPRTTVVPPLLDAWAAYQGMWG